MSNPNAFFTFEWFTQAAGLTKPTYPTFCTECQMDVVDETADCNCFPAAPSLANKLENYSER